MDNANVDHVIYADNQTVIPTVIGNDSDVQKQGNTIQAGKYPKHLRGYIQCTADFPEDFSGNTVTVSYTFTVTVYQDGQIGSPYGTVSWDPHVTVTVS